jgi:hypothetical protein
MRMACATCNYKRHLHCAQQICCCTTTTGKAAALHGLQLGFVLWGPTCGSWRQPSDTRGMPVVGSLPMPMGKDSLKTAHQQRSQAQTVTQRRNLSSDDTAVPLF